MKRIFISGGHLTPALAVGSELKSRGWEIYYLGRLHALEGDNVISPEIQETHLAGFTFLPLTTGRLQRNFTRYTLLSIIKIPIGFIQTFSYLFKFRPQIILSFGGYLAVPVVIGGWFLRIPIVTHEQTLRPGLANKLLHKFAKKVCIAWKKTTDSFPKSKTIYTGNPLRPEIFKIIKTLPIVKEKPLLYITGGNLGAHTINILIKQIIHKLLAQFTVVHQCGNAQELKDYNDLNKIKATLAKDLAKRFYIYPYISVDNIGWLLNQADLMVSRAGANIITEVIALQKPTLFIPLPWSGEGEQEINANFLTLKQAALTIDQKNLSGQKLLGEIRKLYDSRLELIKNLQKLNVDINLKATPLVADVVESVA